MKIKLLSILCVFFLIACNSSIPSFDQVVNSMVKAEKSMESYALVTHTASSAHKDDFIKFRIMVPDNINNDQAKDLVSKFMSEITTDMSEQEAKNMWDTYDITFDIKSSKDGEILYEGKKEKGEPHVWWKF